MRIARTNLFLVTQTHDEFVYICFSLFVIVFRLCAERIAFATPWHLGGGGHMQMGIGCVHLPPPPALQTDRKTHPVHARLFARINANTKYGPLLCQGRASAQTREGLGRIV